MNPPSGGWLLASLIFDPIRALKNKLDTAEISIKKDSDIKKI